MMELVSSKLYDNYDGGIKSGSASLRHQLTQYQLNKREKIVQARNASSQLFESALYSLKEQECNLTLSTQCRPIVGLSCSTCCPTSRSLAPSESGHVVNVFKPETFNNCNNNDLLSYFSTLKHCLTFKKFHYPYIYESVLNDETLKESIGPSAQYEAAEHGITDPEGFAFFVEKNTKRVKTLLNAMHSRLSDTFIRIIAYILYKTLPMLYSGMSIPKGQIDMLQRAASSGLPLICLPLHRSHMDYIIVSFLLSNSNIKVPLVAAGENLRIPVFGNLMSRLGAFYIKRRMDPVSGKKDLLYRAVLQNYMIQCIQAGFNFEVFIEGGRTRTGKPCMPKGGLLSIFVDAYLSGILEDALLVPISINYDRLVEGNFISELTGTPKKKENFISTIQALWKAITSHYGHVRIDINQPFSLHELVKSFQTKLVNNGGNFHIAPSSASLHGTDIVNEDHRQLVESIARHVLYDCSRSTSVMSTNALAFLLLNCYRSGTTLSQLTYALDRLREQLSLSRKDTGFTGESKDVIEHAVKLLGPGLVQVEKKENDKFLRPVSVLPNIIELSYYSNTLVAHFCLQGVVGRTLLCLTAEKANARVTLDKVIDVSIMLCEILQYEFIFTKSCQKLDDVIFDIVERMTVEEQLLVKDDVSYSFASRNQNYLGIYDEDDDEYEPLPINYTVNRNEEKLLVYGGLLEPIIDVYCIVANHLPIIVAEVVPENCFLKELLAVVKEHIENGSIKYAESLSMDTVKNCVKVLEKWKVLDCHIKDGIKLYYLNTKYDSADLLIPIINKIDQFKHWNNL